MKSWYENADWCECYDLIQFFSDFQGIRGGNDTYSALRFSSERFIVAVNVVLEAEKSAYRFVGPILSEITDDAEIAEIEAAFEAQEKYSGAKAHIRLALRKYSDRDNPDYRNSVKESISAVESALSAFNGAKSKNLPAALGEAEKQGMVIHPALRNGISSIYGWTSDEEGVRHGLLEDTGAVSEHEARLMLVLCAAFVNYIASKFQ